MMKLFKGLFKFIFGLVILILIVVAAITFLISSPKKVVETNWTQEDFQSYIDKGGIDFDDSHASVEDFFANNLVTYGEVAVNTTVTNEELTAIANMSINENSVMKDINIKCHDNNEIEISAVVGDLTPLIAQFPILKQFEIGLKLIQNKPIYMYSTLYYDKSTGLFDGVTQQLYIGKVKIPIEKANDNLRPGGTAINNAIKQLEGFSVNEFEVSSEGFKFDGTIPEKIESAGTLLNN